MKNRFNLLTSKEWLPFQKSWFRYTTDDALYRGNIRFFTKSDTVEEKVLYYGKSYPLFKTIAEENNLKTGLLEKSSDKSQFTLIDLRGYFSQDSTFDEYEKLRDEIIVLLKDHFLNLEERRFVSIFIPNAQRENGYFVYAWDLAKHIGQIFSLKDEKIACGSTDIKDLPNGYFQPGLETFYCLYFRKDERSANDLNKRDFNFFKRNTQMGKAKTFVNQIPYWFILKPQPRKKDEILHPAKYPEDLVEMFLNEFTDENNNVFDPMSGTGSTQLGALKLNRNGYGTELSDFFAEIANKRCQDYNSPEQLEVFSEERNHNFKIINKDARHITSDDFPILDYVITSPPYWDMLNMKGAKNQADRKKKGLKTNYSDDPDDIGNIQEYNDFLYTLRDIYFNIASLMKTGGYMTIVVKNIKKKGSNYSFAWDLAHLLQEKLILLPEVFWCQDDISIAPYGYGNTWVSNTFHQYCLTFQVPEDFNKKPD